MVGGKKKKKGRGKPPSLPLAAIDSLSPLLPPEKNDAGFASSEVATAAPLDLSPCDRLSVSPTNHI